VSVTIPVIWPNVWANDGTANARDRLVKRINEKLRRITHLMSF
jgi:hypothetical protein